MWIVSDSGTHRANSQPFGDWEAEENGMVQEKGRLRKDRMQPLGWKKKRFLWNHISYVSVTLTLSTPWMQVHRETFLCRFGRNRTICLREEAIFVPAQKCTYHVTVDLDVDFEHALDAGSPVDHFVQVWLQLSHLCRSRSGLCTKFTDGRTDRRRTPRNCISSWNELKSHNFTQ